MKIKGSREQMTQSDILTDTHTDRQTDRQDVIQIDRKTGRKK